jgi:hypothetical protein
MIRWLIVIFLALMLISWFTPLLQKLGVGKLPGDFRFRLFGREWFIPAELHAGPEHGGGAHCALCLTGAERHACLHRHRRHQGSGQPGA